MQQNEYPLEDDSLSKSYYKDETKKGFMVSNTR